jgi:uncharacterized membrane protein YdjX (TVP38/TMEM64 family)
MIVGSTLPLERGLDALRGWIESLGAWGVVAFALLYALATVLMLPGLVLTVAAGVILGVVKGTIAVSIGSTLGASGAFLIARHLARKRVAELARRHPRLGAVDRAVSAGGWRVVALLRLSPAVPFNLQNYAYGLTAIRFWPCVVTSWIAMLPATIMYVALAHAGGAVASGDRARSAAEWVALGVGVLATVAVAVYLAALARRELHQRVAPDLEAPEPPAAGARRAAWPWGATVAAALATASLAAAVGARLNAPRIDAAISGLFGPPAVVMTEAYAAAPDDGPSFDHSGLDRLLKKHVDADGWVDYDALRGDVGALDGYLRSLATAPLDALGRDERLALLINAYNAFTLKLILDNLPVQSITKLDRPWKGPTWKLGANRWTLDQIEHQQIRPKFKEPRIHFALVCAAAGCPPLRPEAYTAERLEAQLEAQTRYVHEHATWARYDAASNTVHLTRLYDWYGGDFEQAAGSVLEYVARYVPAVRTRLDAGSRPKVRWLPYDWDLNSTANRGPR